MNWKYKLTVTYFLCCFQIPVKSSCSDNDDVNKTIIYTNCELIGLPYTYSSPWTCQDCPRILNITNSHIPIIPSRAFQEFSKNTIFYLNDLSVIKIMPNAFSGHPVQKIYLQNNMLKEISSGIFNALNELEFLDLSGNLLDNLYSNCFVGAAKLTTLNLYNNKLSNFNTSVLDPLVEMKLLNLENNRISKFILIKYINIETVLVSNNQISDLDFCPYIFNVFNASGNLIKELNIDNCIKYDYNCKIIELNLKFNKMYKLDPFVFNKASNLKYLYLNSNNLTHIYSGAFYNLSQLLLLDLSYNKLSYFEHGTFDNLKTLDYLDLSYNRIENLNHTLHSLTSLTKLYLENNTISLLDPEEISINLPNLKIIWIFNNNLSCENLIKINQDFRKKSITIGDNNIRNVSNVHGIACTKNSTTENPTTDINIQILTNNLNNFTSLLKDIKSENFQVKSELQKVLNTSQQINNNFTKTYYNFNQYYSSEKGQLETNKFGEQILSSILNSINENNQLNLKRENITERRFDKIKNSLNNMTLLLKEISDKNENINEERIEIMKNITSFYGEYLKDIKKGLYNFFQGFKNLNKEESFQHTPEFQKFNSGSSDNIEKAQNDKIFIVLVVICVFMAINLFAFIYKYIFNTKQNHKQKQVEILNI